VFVIHPPSIRFVCVPVFFYFFKKQKQGRVCMPRPERTLRLRPCFVFIFLKKKQGRVCMPRPERTLRLRPCFF